MSCRLYDVGCRLVVAKQNPIRKLERIATRTHYLMPIGWEESSVPSVGTRARNEKKGVTLPRTTRPEVRLHVGPNAPDSSYATAECGSD